MFPGSAGGTLTIWLSGGSISYEDYGSWSGWVDPSGGLLSSFDGEWVTLNQYMGYLDSYSKHLGNISDDERLKIIAHGVVRGAGGIGDWRFIAGFYGLSAVGGAALAESGLLAGGSEADSVLGSRFIYGDNALQTDLYHSSTILLDSEVVAEGQITYGTGTYVQYNLPGFINGAAGTFQVGGYWLSPGVFYVVHHLFKP